jgi:hypothetical protein
MRENIVVVDAEKDWIGSYHQSGMGEIAGCEME